VDVVSSSPDCGDSFAVLSVVTTWDGDYDTDVFSKLLEETQPLI